MVIGQYRFKYCALAGAVAIAVFPASAVAENINRLSPPNVVNTRISEPDFICYFKTASGMVLNLTHICGNQAVKTMQISSRGISRSLSIRRERRRRLRNGEPIRIGKSH